MGAKIPGFTLLGLKSGLLITIIEDTELQSIGGNPHFFDIFRWNGVVCGGVEVNLRAKVRANRYASPADRL